MGFSFTGQVLRSAQVATGNAPTTGEPDTGVVRDVRPVPGVYDLTAPDFVDAAADQYRAAIVEAAGTTPTEYLVWAANTADLAGPVENDPSWWSEDGTGFFPAGGLDVGTDFTDGSPSVIVTDNGNRSLNRIFSIVVARGDVTDYNDDGWINPDDTDPTSYLGDQPRLGLNPYITLYFAQKDQDTRSGICTLNDAQLLLLGGGLSKQRNDKIITVHYTVGSVRFWWTKNDRFETRFSWQGQNRRWEPNKGSGPKNLGSFGGDKDQTVFQMDPIVRNLPVGAFLPGNPTTPDSYSMLRVGLNPTAAASLPIDKIQVRSDGEASGRFDFSGSPLNGIVGQTNGILQFNPTFMAQHPAKIIWCVYKGFQTSATGFVGKMTDQNLCLAPVPGLTDFPLIRFGSRAYLTPTMTVSDAELLAAVEPSGGTVLVSASTGLLRFSKADLGLADPDSSFASKYFLGEDVIYDGVSLSGQPQPTRKPVQLLDASGNPASANASALYIPTYQYLPTEFTADDSRRGLGVSGVLNAPDGTGAVPDGGADGSVRPGGDNTADTTTGRVRQVADGVSDVFLFSQLGVVETLIVVDYESDLPSSGSVPSGTAYVARELGAHGSKVVLGSDDKIKLGDKAIFFLQAAFNPAVHTTNPRILSRNRDIFRFAGTEVLRFAIDGTGHTWLASTILAAYPTNTFFTPEQVAASINLVVACASVSDGHVVLSSASPTGSVEIGFGVGTDKDLSGDTVLGFLPGWRVVGGVDNWLPDSGVTLGLYRSPVNANGVATSDFKETDRVRDLVLSSAIPGNPFQFLDVVPLQDIAGFDDEIFFNLSAVVSDGDTISVLNKPLKHYEDIVYRFGQKKFDWVTEGFTTTEVETATATLNLGSSGVVPESLEAVVGGFLSVSPDGGPFVRYKQGEDYLLPQNGSSGTALLVHKYGKQIAFGGKAVFTKDSPTVTDSEADFTAAKVGDLFISGITSDKGGVYFVASIVDANTITITPTPDWDSSDPIQWEIREWFPDSVYNPAIVMDMAYQDFSYLPQESMVIRVLSPLNHVGGSDFAFLAKAVANQRPISLRFGFAPPSDNNTATLTGLRQGELGDLSHDLAVPDTSSLRFNTAKFSIKVGSKLFTHDDGTLVGVTEFNSDPFTVQYLTADSGTDLKGKLRFSDTVYETFSDAKVYYVEEFLLGGDLEEGQAEYNSTTGQIVTSDADTPDHSQTEVVYLVEQLITDNRLDVSINPLLGAFSVNTSLSVGCSVEVSYWQADVEGRKIGNHITEFLPVFVRDEVATLTIRNTYIFNVDRKHRIDQTIEPIVYIGPIMQNFGRVDYIVDYPADLLGQGRLTFVSHVVPDNVDVKISYGVFDMLGGERSFEVSTKPVYRPPFFITANQSRFGLRGNRVSEFAVGQLLRIGEECFYIKGLQYYPQNAAGTGDVTAVSIFPPTTHEVGSRSPGNDVLTVISSDPVTTVVDPDGVTPVATTAPAGFMSVIDLNDFHFEPISRGQTVVIFQGDLTQFAISGHILEIGGCPYTIASSQLTADGSNTSITLTAGVWKGFSTLDYPTVKLSYRPVYPPNATDLIGCGPFVDSEEYALAIFPRGKPGGKVDYTIDATTGYIKLKTGTSPGDRLGSIFTRWTILRPYMKLGTPVIPSFQASYLKLQTPSEDNGLLGGTLTGTYSYRNPDSFYFRSVRLKSFLGEVVQEVIQEIANKQPASGAMVFSREGMKNWQQGRTGPRGELRHLKDKDRVARTFLDFYNSVVQGFEQIEETISGGFVGDRDGKFRFEIGHGKDFPTPGYEDAITGYLTTRNLWADVVNSATPSAHYFGLLSDLLVTPDTLQVVNGLVQGDLPDTSALDRLLDQQKQATHNDVDDVVLVGLQDVKAITLFPINVGATGDFQPMWQEHQFSRLFPTVTTAFVRTLPGIGYDPVTGDPGIYTAGRKIGSKHVSTTGTTIAQLQNPAVGIIHNIHSANLHKRKARSRIWGYFPTGIPADALGTGLPPSNITYPCLIAVPALLRDVPIRPDTGYPDSVQFLSQGGSVPDAKAGDPVLVVPGFVTGDQIAWGKPDGTNFTGFNGGDPKTIYGTPTYTGLFVCDVLYGCVISFQDVYGVQILNPAFILAGTDTADQLPVNQGDTVYVGDTSDVFTTSPPDPPEFSTFQTLANGMDMYRDGTDIKITADGQLIDITMSSAEDGSFSALKEMFGQNSPKPLAALEGPVHFFLETQNPLEIPALSGKYQDDSGDYQLPYVLTANTELDRFSQASAGLSLVMSTIDPLTHAVYPNEIVGDDGLVVTTEGFEPATLKTALNTSPGFGPGEGNVQPYDLLLIQTSTPNPFSVLGARGIHAVGSVTAGGTSLIEPPRFISATKAPPLGSAGTGDPIQYSATNAMVFVQGPYPDQPQLAPPPGVQIVEDNTTTILEFSSTTLHLNDGVTIGVGNLNYILAANPSNTVKVELIARRDVDILNGLAGANPLPSSGVGGVVAMTIVITSAGWTLYDYQYPVTVSVFVPGVTTFGVGPAPGRQVTLSVPAGINWGPGPGTRAQWYLPHILVGFEHLMLYGFEYSISVDTSVGESHTAWISDDRLTFNEVYDLSFAKKRGYVHPQSGMSLETGLAVTTVTVGQTAAATVVSTLNKHINGLNMADPIPLTFVPRMDTTTVGTWVPRDGNPALATERGTLKAMGFEGHSNVAGDLTITGTDATFAAVPSNGKDTNGIIFTGLGKTASRFNTNLSALKRQRYDNRIAEISAATGFATSVQSGDILVVKSSANTNHPATHQAGTYLVRHAVDATGGNPYLKTAPQTTAGTESGWCPVHFPTTVSFDDVSETLIISDLAPAAGGPSSGTCGFATPAAGVTRIYIIRNVPDLASGDVDTYKNAVISANYTARLGTAFLLADYKDARGTGMSAAAFKTLVDSGPYQVSGMAFWPVNVSGQNYGLPTNNCVGFDSESTGAGPGVDWAVYGFRKITFVPVPSLSAASSVDFWGDTPTPSGNQILKVTGTARTLVPVLETPVTAYQFHSDAKATVYDWVTKGLDVREVTHTLWASLNITAGSFGSGGSLVDCVLPGTGLSLGDGVTPGFYAQSGVFLEPSFPRSAMSLSLGYANVVDASHSVPNPSGQNDWERSVGMRAANIYAVSGATNVPDEVTFEVRRIRRFHEINTISDQNLAPLRFAYEIRRGRITAYTTTVKQNGVLAANSFVMNWETTKPGGAPKAPDVWNDGGTYTGTNLGGFAVNDVNIHAGDTLRLLDVYGNAQEEIQVVGVESSGTMILAAPGLRSETAGALVGMRFEVYLKQAPVPHEQSCEELLALMTDKKVTRTDADWQAQTGGYVKDMIDGLTAYGDVVNKLYDDLNAPGSGQTFGALGVKKGDIIVIDPAGTIPQIGGLPAIQEKGERPIGDEGVPARVVAGVYVAGSPDSLDDNRGFYRVKAVVDTVDPPYLSVNPINIYAGAGTVEAPFVVFGAAAQAYAVYPTVTDSNLQKAPYPVDLGKEGQMDLRPTRVRDGTTESFVHQLDGFTGHSIRPFSYQIIRPSPLFSDQAVDLILTMRERMLSLIELFRRGMTATKSGSYFVFQRDEHLKELGSPTDPDIGLGIPSNLYIEAIGGRVGIAPYANNSACLSLLDRRVWVHDTRLDSLTTNGFGGMKMTGLGDTAYTAYTDNVGTGSSILPVLPERIEGILESKDKFRPIRFVWLAYRTHKVLGTLVAIRQLEKDLPDQLEQQKKLLMLQVTMQEGTT